jgi:hypothetical protein
LIRDPGGIEWNGFRLKDCWNAKNTNQLRRIKMCSEETKEKKDEAGCSSPENFKSMFEMMGKCCTDRSGFDCSSMMEAMKSQSCCGPKKEKEEKSSCC